MLKRVRTATTICSKDSCMGCWNFLYELRHQRNQWDGLQLLDVLYAKEQESLNFSLLVVIEGLITEFQCVTVSYGIECSFLVIT